MLENVKYRAITKNGHRVPGPLGVKNGYSLESRQKHTPRATRLAKNKSYPFSTDNDPGTTVNAYYAWLSAVFVFLLNQLPIVYIVLHCCFGRSFLTFFLWAFALSIFHYEYYFNVLNQPLCAPGYVCPHIPFEKKIAYKPCTYISLRLLYYSTLLTAV